MSSSPNVVASAPTATADSKPAAKAPPQLTVVTTTPTTERQAILQLKEQCMAELRYWSSVLEQQTGADDFDDDDDAIPDGDGGDSVKHPPPQDVTTREEKSSFSFATMATQTYDDAEKSSIVTGHHHHQHDLHEQEEEEGIRPLPPEGDILYPSPSTRTADKSTKQAAAAEILHQISVGTSVRMRSPRNDNNNDNTNDNSFSKKQQQFINFITPGKPVGLLTSTSPKSTSSSIGLLPLPIILDRNHHKSNPKKRSGAAPSSEASVASATSALTMATAKPVSYSSSGQPQQQPQHFSSSEQQRKSGFVGIRELLNWDTESTTHQDQDSMAPLPTTLSMEARTAFKSPSAMAAKRLGLWRKKGWEEDHKVDEGDDESDSEKKVEYWWEHLENDPLGAAASAAEDEKNNNITCLVWGCTAKNDVAQTHSMLMLEEEGTEGDTAATESNKNGNSNNNTAQDWSSHLEDAVSPRRKRFVDIFATAIQTAYRRRLAQRRYRYVGQIIVRIQRWWRFRYGMKTLRTQYRRDQLRLAAGRQSRWAAQQLRLKQLHDKQREEQEDLHHDLLDELQRRADALRQRKEQEARALALLKEKEAEEFRKQKEREAEEFRKQTELEIQSFLEKKQREVEEIRQQKQREAEDDISKALTQDEMNFMMTIPESSSDLLLNNNNNNHLEGQQLAPWDRNTCAMACTMLEIFQNAFCDHPQTTAASEEDDPKKKTTTTTTNKKTPTTTSATTTLSKRFQWSNFPLLLDLLNKKSLEEEEEEEGGGKDIVDKENGFCNNHESTAATDEKANEGVDEELEQVEAQPPPTLTPIDAVDKSFAPEEQSSKDQEEPVLPSSSCTEQQEQQQQQQVEQPILKEEEEKEITRHNETQVAGMFDDTVTKEESLCEVLMDGQPRENLFRLQVETDEAAKVLAIRNQDDHAQQEQQEEQQEQQQQQDFIFYLSNASSNVPQDQQVISNMSKVSTKVPQEEAADNDVHSDAPSDELGEECPYQEAQVQQQSSPNEEPADGVTAQVGSSTIEERIQQQHLQKTTRSSAQEESVHRHGHYEETSVGGFEPSTGTEIGEHGIVALGKSRSVTPPPHRSIRMDYVAIGDSNSLLWEDSRSDTGRRNDDANMDKAAGEEGGDLPAIPSDEVEDDKEKPNDEHRGESDTSQAGESGGDAVETNDAVSQLETTPESHQPVVDLSVQSKAEGEVTDDAIIQDPLDKKCVSNVVDEPNEVVLDKPHSFALFRCCAKIDDIALGDSTSLNFYEGDEFETKNDASMGTPLAERLDNDGHAALDGSDKTRHDKRDINEMGVSAIALVSQDAVTFDQDSAAQKGEEIESPTTSKRLTAEPDKSLSDIVQPESVVKASGSNSNVEEHNTCENLVEKNSICSKEESAVADSTDIVLVRPSNFSLFRCCARMDDIVVDQSKSLELHDFGGDEFRATRDDENMDKAGDDKLSEEVHEDQGQADEVDGTPRQDHLDYTEDKPKTGANHDAIAGDKNVATSDVALLTTNQSEDSNKYENENGSFKSKFVEMIDRLEREEEEQAFRSQSPSVAESIIRSQSIGEIYARDERSRLLERKNASATIESAFVGLDDKQHELLLAKSRSFTFFPCWTRFHAQEEEMPFDESRSIVVDESSSFVVDESKSRPCGVTDHDLEKHLTSDLRKSKEEVYTETASASVNIGTDRPLDEEMDVAKSTSQNHEEQRIVAASASQNERSEGGEAPALGPSLSTFSERGSPNVALSTGQSENNPVVDTQEESHFDESKQLELKCSRGAEIEVSCLNTVNPEEETEEVTSKVLANDHDCAKAPVDARLEENDSTRTEACVYNAFLESEVDQHHEVEDIAAKGSIHHNGCVETPVDPGPEGESSICTEGPGDSVLLGGAAVKENDEVGDVTANDDKAAIDTNTCPETSIDSGPGEASTCTEEVRDDNVLPGAEINQQDEVVVDGTANDDVAAMDNDTSTEPPIDSTRKGETSTRTEVQEEDALLQAEKVEAGGVTANVDAAAAIDIDIGTSTETPVDSTLDEKACTRTEVQDENALLEADQVEASVVTANVDDAAAIDICTSTETPVDPSLEEKASTCTEVKDDNVLLEPGVNQGDSVVDVTAIEAAAATDSNSRPETPVDPSLDEKASTCTEERDDDVVLVAEVKLQDEVVDGTANDDGTAIDSNTCLETPVDSRVSICTEVQEEDALLEAEKVEAGGVIANVDAAIDIDIGTSTETPVDSSLDEKTSTRTEVQDKNALLEVEANDVTENVDATAIDIATVIKTPVDSSLEEVASTCTQVRNKNVLGGSTSPETPVDSSLDEKAFTCTEVQDDDVVLVAEVNQQDVVVVTTNDDEAIDIGTSTETRVDSSLDEKASTRTEVQEEDVLLEAEKVEAVGVTANVDAAIDIGTCTETPVDSSLDEIASTRTEVQDENALLEADEVEAGGVTANVDDAAAIDIGTSMETPVDSKPEREASTSTKVRHDNVPPDDEANEQDDSDEVAADDDDAIEIGTGPETAIETRLPPEEDDSTLTEVLVDQQAGLSEIEAKLDTINRSNELTYSASGADQCDIVEVEANDISIDQRSTVSDEKHLPTTGSLFDQQGDLSALKEKTDPRGEERGTEQSDNDADDAEHAFEENYVKKLEQTESEASLVVASTEELPCSKIQIAEPERQDEEAINPKSSAGAYCAGDGSRNEIAPANGEASSAYTETQKSTLVDNTQSSALIAADTDAHQHVAKESKATSFEESARDEDEADRHVEPENESSREVPTEQKDECTQLEDRDDPEEAPKAETAEKSACDDLTKRYSFYKPLERPEIKDTNTEEVQTHPDNDMEKAASEAASSGHPTKLDKEQNIVAEQSAPATKEASSVELDAQRENVSRSSRIFSFFPCCTAMDIQDDVVPMDNSKLEACDKDEETVQAEIENYSVDEPAGQKLENLLPAVDVHPKAAVIVEGTKDSSVESSNCESPTKRYHFYEPRVGSPSEGHTETTEAPETEVATVDPSTKRFSYYKPIVDEQTEDVQNQVDDSNGHLDDAPKPEKPNDAGESTVLETPAQQKEDHKRTLETNGDATARGLLRSLVSVDAVEQPESQNILYRKDGLRKCDEVAPVQPADDEPEDMFNENADDEVEVAIDKDPSSGESEESIEVALSKARRRRAKERRRQELDDVCLERFSSREALEKEILLSMSKSTECSTARELTQLGSGGAENDGLLDDTSCGEIERFSSREAFEDVVLGQIGSRDPFARIESKSEKVRNKADMNVPEEDYAEPAMPQIESLANSALMVNNQVEEAAAPRSGESDHGDDKTCKVKPNEKVQIEEASKDPVVTSSNIKDDHAEANGESKEAEAEGKGANEQLIMVKVQDDHVEVEVTQRNGDTDNQEEGGDGDYCEGMIESQDSGSSILAETNTQRDIIPDNTRSFTMFGCCVKMEDGALDTANSIEMGESAFEERQDFFMCKANLKEEEIVFHKFNQGVDDDDDDDDDDTYNNQAGAEAISSPLPTIVERDSSNGSMQDEGEEEEEQRQEKSAMEQQQDQENEQLQQAEEPIIVDHKESPEKKGPSSPDIVLNNTRSFTFFTCCAKMQDDPLVGMVNSLEEEEASSPAAEPAETSPKTTSAVETSRDTNYVPPPIKQQNSTDRKLEELERNLIRLRKQRCFDELLGWVNEGEDIWLQQQKSNEK